MIKTLKHPQNNEHQGILDYKLIMHFYPSIRLAKKFVSTNWIETLQPDKMVICGRQNCQIDYIEKTYTWILIQTSRRFIHLDQSINKWVIV